MDLWLYLDPQNGSIISLVHNIDPGLSVKTASKAPLYAGADAGIEISSIPASSVSVERQYCEPDFRMILLL